MEKSRGVWLDLLPELLLSSPARVGGCCPFLMLVLPDDDKESDYDPAGEFILSNHVPF